VSLGVHVGEERVEFRIGVEYVITCHVLDRSHWPQTQTADLLFERLPTWGIAGTALDGSSLTDSHHDPPPS
jgi:hypothetical protein